MRVRPGWFLAAVLTLTSAGGLEAQAAVGDSAWQAGDFHTARIAYERELATNPSSTRANFRLGILASWDGRLDSALVLIRRARAVEPFDADLLVGEARVLSWAGRFNQALRQYDSALALIPGHRDAELGRAQALAWANRLEAADSAYAAMLERDPLDLEAASGQAQVLAWSGRLVPALLRYRAVLDRDPDNVRALTGTARVYEWRGRPFRAREYVRRARQADSTDRDARELERQVTATLQPRVELTAAYSEDSDDNQSWWQTGTLSSVLSDGVRGFLTVGALEASDPFRDATRVMGEGGLSWARGNLQLTGALGARRLSPDSAPVRTEPTWRSGISYRLAPGAGVGLGYAHYPFDETALLIGRNLDLDALEGSADVTLHRGLTLGLGGGYAWLSDGNARRSGVVAMTQEIHRKFFIGGFGRILSYEGPGFGYFTPDRFTILEGRTGWTHDDGHWLARLSGGLGVQQIAKGATTQSEWHVEARFGRTWNVVNAVEVFGSLTNSAESSTTGAFRYGSAGLVIRLGL